MNSVPIGATLDLLAERWWAPVVRGAAAVLFGILALVAPSIGLLALVIGWGTYAIIDGVFNVFLAARGGRIGGRWGWFLFEGIVSIGAGVLTFVYPGMTAFVLLMVIAAWAVLTGIIEIAAAIELRRVMTGEWVLALSGVFSIVFGVLLFTNPRSGALAIVWLVGAYAIVFGGLLISLGIKLRRWHRGGARPFPTGGAPPPA